MIGNRNLYGKDKSRRNLGAYKVQVAPADQARPNRQENDMKTDEMILPLKSLELEVEATLKGGDLQSLWSGIDSLTKE